MHGRAHGRTLRPGTRSNRKNPRLGASDSCTIEGERKELRDFNFDIKFGEPEATAIEFGHYRGQRKWPTLMHIPDQRIRDALMNLIIYQGDTEFASVEQQRNLLVKQPSDHDMLAIMRVMCEEMRHGWQMSYLLCEHFGDEGRREAAKLLERNALEGQRRSPEAAGARTMLDDS